MPDLADSSDDDMPGLSPLSASSSDEENFVVSGDIMIDELLTIAPTAAAEGRWRRN